MQIRTIGLSLAMLMPATFLLGQAAVAQTQSAASVTVTGKRGTGGDPTVITAAKSKVLSRTMASGCNYMSAYSAAEDDVTQAYMRDMGMEDSISNDAQRIRENSPNGDVSSVVDASSVESNLPADAAPAAGGCTGGDLNFAAGRNRILRKDKSLAEAFVAFDARDYAKAQTLAKAAYNKIGFDEAALMLAKIQLYGLGTPRNTPEAIVWLKKITEARFDPMRDTFKFDPAAPEQMTERIEATLTLAKIYLRGMGTPKNPAEAVKWYVEAERIGFIPAKNTLGMAQLNGFGGPQDARKALAYFKEAAEAGYAPAQYNLGKMYYAGDHGVPQDMKLAGAWFNAAAKSGHAGALYGVGRMYDLGNGVAADQKKAIVYYKEAALKSNADAQSALATYFYTGEVVAKDLATARKLFAAAANQGQPDAMFNLGVMSVNGEGGAKDMATAYVWFTLAKNMGNKSAEDALKAIGGKLTVAEMAKADSVLKPKPKTTKVGG
jgi:TPR repeat protein